MSHHPIMYLATCTQGPILLADPRLNRSATLQVTLAACVLTLANLVFPNTQGVDAATVADRLIAVMALLVTGWLSDRMRRYEEAIAEQKAQLHAQEQLASLRENFASTLTHDLKTPLLGAIETLKSFQQGLIRSRDTSATACFGGDETFSSISRLTTPFLRDLREPRDKDHKIGRGL